MSFDPRTTAPEEPVEADAPVTPAAAAAAVNIDREPQAGDDGKVYVSDDISDQAVAAGHAPDLQPRAHPGGVVVGQGSGTESIFEPNAALKASVAEGAPTPVALAEMKVHGTLPTLEGEAAAGTLVGVTPASVAGDAAIEQAQASEPQPLDENGNPIPPPA